MRLTPRMRLVMAQWDLRQSMCNGSVMPYSDEQRTFNGLVRRGLIVYEKPNNKHRYHGYVKVEQNG